jgi:ArsR family transcriptional regulator
MDVERKAQLLRVIAHPTRLKIIERLAAEAEPLCVSDLEPDLGIPQPNVSQHLAVLRKAGVVDFYVDGRLRCYFLKDPRIADIAFLLDVEVEETLPSPACCAAKAP